MTAAMSGAMSHPRKMASGGMLGNARQHSETLTCKYLKHDYSLVSSGAHVPPSVVHLPMTAVLKVLGEEFRREERAEEPGHTHTPSSPCPSPRVPTSLPTCQQTQWAESWKFPMARSVTPGFGELQHHLQTGSAFPLRW